MNAQNYKPVLGVALLEVLVATTIITVGVSAALFGIRQSVTAQSRLEREQLGIRLAEQQVALLRASGLRGLEDDAVQAFPPPYERYSWTAKVFESSDAHGVRMLRLQVFEDQATYPIARLEVLAR